MNTLTEDVMELCVLVGFCITVIHVVTVLYALIQVLVLGAAPVILVAFALLASFDRGVSRRDSSDHALA